MEIETHYTHSELETIELGSKFAEKIRPGHVVLFYGELGSGKTEFIKGICNYFSVEEIVTSPTFTIMNQYNGEFENKEFTIYHIDLYRIKTKEELDEIGFEDCIFAADTVKLVEWAENASNLVKFANYSVTFKSDFEIENDRMIQINCLNSAEQV